MRVKTGQHDQKSQLFQKLQDTFWLIFVPKTSIKDPMAFNPKINPGEAEEFKDCQEKSVQLY